LNINFLKQNEDRLVVVVLLLLLTALAAPNATSASVLASF
jgi:hypothetical protein